MPFVWAKALENAPVPTSATATPTRQNRAAIKMRRLKKADCEVDFFFMDAMESISLAVEPEIVNEMLGDVREVCQ